MINALDPKRVCGLIAVVVLILFAGSTLVLQMLDPLPAGADPWARLFDAAKHAIILLNVLLALMAWSPLLWLIHTATFAKHWWFPWVGGEWSGEVKSNWGHVEAMMIAAADPNAPRFDALKDTPPPAPDVKVKATIECRLFSIKIHFDMIGTERFSDTVFVRPERKPGERPRLHYIYLQQDRGKPAPTDRRDHYGAATLELTTEENLEGRYWNARNEERGLNTAGIVVLRPAKKPHRRKRTKT
ncbi:MAG: hypothetical protein ACK4S3_06105 [Parvibaculum sp.]